MSCPYGPIRVRVLIYARVCSLPKPTFVPAHRDASRNPLPLKRKGRRGVKMERETKHRWREAKWDEESQQGLKLLRALGLLGLRARRFAVACWKMPVVMFTAL